MLVGKLAFSHMIDIAFVLHFQIDLINFFKSKKNIYKSLHLC